MDVFISHSSADSEMAARVEKTLEDGGLEAWLDRSEIHLGALLRNELQTQIKKSRAVILLWSKPAAASRWVAAEVLTAFHLKRFIVPCVLDRTRLPQFLASTVYVDFRKDAAGALKSLSRAAREAPKAANAVLPLMSSQSPELLEFIRVMMLGQAKALEMLGQRRLDDAREIHKRVDDIMRQAEKA
ncbi:MAG: toll/interleukin-1 receptor domain-containing protein [Acidobacteria bacterium]|nr:toll/interleukin-1 receptor domain-containing protein [Acidobacteriota bacterium]